MTKTLEFYFDFGSPTAYLAFTQAAGLARRLNADLVYRPMLLGAVHKATGNQSPVAVPAKGKWMTGDLQKWAEFYRVQLNMNPFFPINTLPIMRGCSAYYGTDRFEPYLHAMFKGLWIDGKNLGDPEVIAQTVEEAGIDPAEFQAKISDQAVKDDLKARTEEAVARGCFGAPTFFVGDEMFFGQDRLHFVGEALGADYQKQNSDA